MPCVQTGAKRPAQRSFIYFTVLIALGGLYNANSLLVEVSEERVCAVVIPGITVNVTFIFVKKKSRHGSILLVSSKINVILAQEYLTVVRSVNPISKDMYHYTNCG